MEAVERLATHYPELESLSQLLKALNSNVRAVGELSCKHSVEEARAEVHADLRELCEFADNCVLEAEKLRPEMNELHLGSLSVLHAHLQSEQQNNPESPRAVGLEGLCDGLRNVLDSVEHSASPATNTVFEAWVREFWQEPLEEIREQNQKVQTLLESSSATEQSMVKHIKSLSEQISQPGFNPNALELMNTRSVLVQQLLSALGMKQSTIPSYEPRDVLKGKLQAFERAYDASTKRLCDERSRHATIVEDLSQRVESVTRYLQQKDRAHASEQKAAAGRRSLRMAKIRWVAEALQQAFTDLFETLQECRSDSARLVKAELVKTVATEFGEKLQKRLSDCRSVHVAYAQHLGGSLALQERFAGWLREANMVMSTKASRSAGKIRASRMVDRARMVVLSRSAVEQVRFQRDQTQIALQQAARELEACQASLSATEHSTTSKEELTGKTRQHEQIQQVVAWQQSAVQVLTDVERHISQDVAEVMDKLGDPKEGDSIHEDEWAHQIEDAEAWASEFFYTCLNTVPSSDLLTLELQSEVVDGHFCNDKVQDQSNGDSDLATPLSCHTTGAQESQQHRDQQPLEETSEHDVVTVDSEVEIPNHALGESLVFTPDSISAISPDRSKVLDAPPSCLLHLRQFQLQADLRKAINSDNSCPAPISGPLPVTRQPFSHCPSLPCTAMMPLTISQMRTPTRSSSSAVHCMMRPVQTALRLSATPPAPQARLPRSSSDVAMAPPQTARSLSSSSSGASMVPQSPGTARVNHQAVKRTPPIAHSVLAPTGVVQAAGCDVPYRTGLVTRFVDRVPGTFRYHPSSGPHRDAGHQALPPRMVQARASSLPTRRSPRGPKLA